MAYISQEKKKEIAIKLKEALKGSRIKYSLSVHHHSRIVMNIKSGPIDFLANMRKVYHEKHLDRDLLNEDYGYLAVNPYHYKSNYDGEVLEILNKIFTCLNDGNWDESDIMSDYFNVGWYVSVNIGKYDQPYVLTA